MVSVEASTKSLFVCIVLSASCFSLVFFFSVLQCHMTGPSDEQCLAHVPASGDCVFLCIETNADGDLGISHG